MSRSVCLAVVACISCGKTSRSTKSEGGVPARTWEFIGFVDAPRNQLAVVTSGSGTALVAADGKLTPPIKSTSESVSAVGNGEMVILEDGETLRCLDRAGRELWVQRFTSAKAAMGSSTTAIANTQRSTILDLSTGKGVYDGSPAKRVFYRRGDGYVFLSDDEIWLIDENSRKERWRTPVAGLSNAGISHGRTSLLVIRPDRTFDEYDYTSGKRLEKGRCPGEPPEEDERNPLACAGEPTVDRKHSETSMLLSRDDDGDYFLIIKGGADTRLLARDIVGRTRWTVKWPASSVSLKSPALHDTDSTVTAFVVGRTEARTVVAFNVANGHVSFERPLGVHDQVAGFAGSCLLIVASKSVDCIDKISGNMAWSSPITGDKVAVWPVGEADALIASGNPLVLARVGKDGHTLWQTDIPDAEVQKTEHTATLVTAGKPWRFSDVLGVVAAGEVLSVIDLERGKVEQVR